MSLSGGFVSVLCDQGLHFASIKGDARFVLYSLCSHIFQFGYFLELVSKELNHLAAILHVYAGGLNFMK